MVIVIDFETSLVPHSFLQVAVYTPVSFTISTLPVLPVLHVIVLLQFVAVNVAKFASQQIVLSVDIIGEAGFPPTAIVSTFELKLDPQILLQVAV